MSKDVGLFEIYPILSIETIYQTFTRLDVYRVNFNTIIYLMGRFNKIVSYENKNKNSKVLTEYESSSSLIV